MPVQGMIQTTVLDPDPANGTQVRSQKIVLVADGNVYLSSNFGTPAIVSGGSGALDPGVIPQMCQVSGAGKVFIVDGTATIRVVDTKSAALSSMTATAGELPVNAGDDLGPAICCIYRNRLVLAGTPGDEQNFYMSRSGTYTDFDYSQRDPGAAVAGNTMIGGSLPDIITALIPYVDDTLILGGDHTMHQLTGDPTAGGSIDQLSNEVGVIAPQAWCRDPVGQLYFLAANGLYTASRDGQIQALSLGRYTKPPLLGLDRSKQIHVMIWCPEWNGCWLFITSRTSENSTHLWYQAGGNNGFWPMQFPVNHGPVSAMYYDGDASQDGLLMLGGRNGFIYGFTTAVANDDGAAIQSYCFLGPERPIGDARETKLLQIEAILGEPVPPHFDASSWNLDYTIQAGTDVYAAYSAPRETRTGAWTAPGRQTPQGVRMTANSFFMKVENNAVDKIFSLERIAGVFRAAGRERGG